MILTHAEFLDPISSAQESQSCLLGYSQPSPCLHHSDPGLWKWPGCWSAHFAEGLGFSIFWPWASPSSRKQSHLCPSYLWGKRLCSPGPLNHYLFLYLVSCTCPLCQASLVKKNLWERGEKEAGRQTDRQWKVFLPQQTETVTAFPQHEDQHEGHREANPWDPVTQELWVRIIEWFSSTSIFWALLSARYHWTQERRKGGKEGGRTERGEVKGRKGKKGH